jgi:hypothetical protein
MKIVFTLTDNDGTQYEGVAELAQTLPQEYGNSGATAGDLQLGLPDRILKLREQGFFKEPRTPTEVHAELAKTYHCVLNRVEVALVRLLARRQLRKSAKKVDKHEQAAYVW